MLKLEENLANYDCIDYSFSMSFTGKAYSGSWVHIYNLYEKIVGGPPSRLAS